MTASFSALEERVNAAVGSHLSNATATIGGGTVDGLFSNGFVDSFGLSNSAKAFTCPSSAIPNLAYGDSVTINAVVYTVAETHPDGTGMTRVLLK